MFKNNSITPKSHWGNYLWGFIHTITIIDYTNNVNYNTIIIDRLHSITNVFPCPKCKETYKEYLLKLNNIDTRSPMSLFYWSVDLHNAVNTKLGKPTMTYSQAKNIWCNC